MSPPSTGSPFRASIAALLASPLVAGPFLLLVTLATYAPVFTAGFVWNDRDYVTAPGLRSFAGLWSIWFEVGSTEQHYPLLHSFFWLQHRLWGDAPLGYHLVNVLLHALAALLLALCLRQLFRIGPPPAGPLADLVPWLAGFLFALHPVSVESVAWISEQKNTLSLVFYLAAALAYLRFDARRRPGDYRLATLLFAAALLSKTLTASLPAALLVVLWWRRGTLTWERDVRPLLPWLLLGALFGLFSAWVERTVVGAATLHLALTPAGRILVAGRAVWFYLGKLLWPADLVFIYPRWRIDASDVTAWLYPLAALLALAALWDLRRRVRGPLAAALFFGGSLFPVLGFFNLYGFRYAYVADHWQYLPSLGVHVLFAFALGRLLLAAPRPPARIAAGLALTGLLATLAIFSWRETHFYRDLETFYRTIIARSPTSRLGYNNLSSLLLTDIDLRPVTARFRLARTAAAAPPGSPARWQLVPLDPTAPLPTREAWPLPARRVAEALQLLQHAIAAEPTNIEARSNLGYLLAQLGELDAGVAEIEAALRIRPDFTDALLNLGNLRIAQGRYADALRPLRLALRLDPHFAVASNSLANTLLLVGQVDAAIRQYGITLRLAPDFFEARINLGNALLQAGRTAEAVASYERALAQNPASAEGHNNLGYAFLQLGRPADALPHFERALALWPDYVTARANLDLARRALADAAPTP